MQSQLLRVFFCFLIPFGIFNRFTAKTALSLNRMLVKNIQNLKIQFLQLILLLFSIPVCHYFFHCDLGFYFSADCFQYHPLLFAMIEWIYFYGASLYQSFRILTVFRHPGKEYYLHRLDWISNWYFKVALWLNGALGLNISFDGSAILF